MGSFTQTLNQSVCQKYGWGIRYGADEDTGYWIVDVFYAIGKYNRYTAPIPSREKQGKAVVSEIALQGLKEIIEEEECKETIALSDVFPDPITVYDSYSQNCWERFWNDPPACVGVDAEGNQISPPVLVQISTESYTILEVPLNGRLSDDLQRLLKTDSIAKIFCDNFSNRDKKCLGLNIDFEEGNNEEDNKYVDANTNVKCGKSYFTKPPVVDIEILSLDLLGPVKVPRGLSKLISLCMPELNVRIKKPGKSSKQRHKNIGKFALIEQGKAKPLRGLFDLNRNLQQYAALDSWCTLKIYQRLLLEIERSKGRPQG